MVKILNCYLYAKKSFCTLSKDAIFFGQPCIYVNEVRDICIVSGYLILSLSKSIFPYRIDHNLITSNRRIPFFCFIIVMVTPKLSKVAF